MTLQEIADLLLDAVADDCREAGLKTLRIHLRPLVADHGDMPVTEADARFLLGFKRKLCERYKPRTVNCYLTAAKRLIRWAASMGFRDPVDLSAIRQTQVPVPENKSMTAEELASMFYRSELLDQRVTPWIGLQLVAALRPSEAVRVILGEARVVSENVYALDEHKTATKSRMPRFIAMNPTALRCLEMARNCSPARKREDWNDIAWTRLDSYSAAVERATGRRPHPLRHTAGTLLVRSGVPRHDADLLLGHAAGGRVSLTYVEQQALEFERLLPATEVLVEHLPERVRFA